MENYMRVCAEINLDAVKANFENMKNRLTPGAQIAAVLKADGYGHGAVPIARMAETFPYIWGFTTATDSEARLLRKSGIKKPILILGYTFPDSYAEIIKNDIRPAVFKLSTAKELSDEAVRQGKLVHIHLKVDTGMSRIGLKDNAEGAAIAKKISELPNVETEGLFTHFFRADEADQTVTLDQFRRYQEFSQKLDNLGIPIKLHHCSNSAAIFTLPAANLSMVRAGVSIYGMYPSDEMDKNDLSLLPAMTLRSHIIYIKEIDAGTQISYGGTFVAGHPMRIATIPVGYADGYPRSLSNKGWVLIRGQRAPILGHICMDQMMVDVTGIPPAEEGDPVTLIGSDASETITMETLGNLSGRFNYELACDIGKRVPRRFWKDGKAVAVQDYFSLTGVRTV